MSVQLLIRLRSRKISDIIKVIKNNLFLTRTFLHFFEQPSTQNINEPLNTNNPREEIIEADHKKFREYLKSRRSRLLRVLKHVKLRRFIIRKPLNFHCRINYANIESDGKINTLCKISNSSIKEYQLFRRSYNKQKKGEKCKNMKFLRKGHQPVCRIYFDKSNKLVRKYARLECFAKYFRSPPKLSSYFERKNKTYLAWFLSKAPIKQIIHQREIPCNYCYPQFSNEREKDKQKDFDLGNMTNEFFGKIFTKCNCYCPVREKCMNEGLVHEDKYIEYRKSLNILERSILETWKDKISFLEKYFQLCKCRHIMTCPNYYPYFYYFSKKFMSWRKKEKKIKDICCGLAEDSYGYELINQNKIISVFSPEDDLEMLQHFMKHVLNEARIYKYKKDNWLEKKLFNIESIKVELGMEAVYTSSPKKIRGPRIFSQSVLRISTFEVSFGDSEPNLLTQVNSQAKEQDANDLQWRICHNPNANLYYMSSEINVRTINSVALNEYSDIKDKKTYCFLLSYKQPIPIDVLRGKQLTLKYDNILYKRCYYRKIKPVVERGSYNLDVIPYIRHGRFSILPLKKLEGPLFRRKSVRPQECFGAVAKFYISMVNRVKKKSALHLMVRCWQYHTKKKLQSHNFFEKHILPKFQLNHELIRSGFEENYKEFNVEDTKRKLKKLIEKNSCFLIKKVFFLGLILREFKKHTNDNFNKFLKRIEQFSYDFLFKDCGINKKRFALEPEDERFFYSFDLRHQRKSWKIKKMYWVEVLKRFMLRGRFGIDLLNDRRTGSPSKLSFKKKGHKKLYKPKPNGSKVVYHPYKSELQSYLNDNKSSSISWKNRYRNLQRPEWHSRVYSSVSFSSSYLNSITPLLHNLNEHRHRYMFLSRQNCQLRMIDDKLPPYTRADIFKKINIYYYDKRCDQIFELIVNHIITLQHSMCLCRTYKAQRKANASLIPKDIKFRRQSPTKYTGRWFFPKSKLTGNMSYFSDREAKTRRAVHGDKFTYNVETDCFQHYTEEYKKHIHLSPLKPKTIIECMVEVFPKWKRAKILHLEKMFRIILTRDKELLLKGNNEEWIRADKYLKRDKSFREYYIKRTMGVWAPPYPGTVKTFIGMKRKDHTISAKDHVKIKYFHGIKNSLADQVMTELNYGFRKLKFIYDLLKYKAVKSDGKKARKVRIYKQKINKKNDGRETLNLDSTNHEIKKKLLKNDYHLQTDGRSPEIDVIEDSYLPSPKSDDNHVIPQYHYFTVKRVPWWITRNSKDNVFKKMKSGIFWIAEDTYKHPYYIKQDVSVIPKLQFMEPYIYPKHHRTKFRVSKQCLGSRTKRNIAGGLVVADRNRDLNRKRIKHFFERYYAEYEDIVDPPVEKSWIVFNPNTKRRSYKHQTCNVIKNHSYESLLRRMYESCKSSFKHKKRCKRKLVIHERPIKDLANYETNRIDEPKEIKSNLQGKSKIKGILKNKNSREIIEKEKNSDHENYQDYGRLFKGFKSIINSKSKEIHTSSSVNKNKEYNLSESSEESISAKDKKSGFDGRVHSITIFMEREERDLRYVKDKAREREYVSNAQICISRRQRPKMLVEFSTTQMQTESEKSVPNSIKSGLILCNKVCETELYKDLDVPIYSIKNCNYASFEIWPISWFTGLTALSKKWISKKFGCACLSSHCTKPFLKGRDYVILQLSGIYNNSFIRGLDYLDAWSGSINEFVPQDKTISPKMKFYNWRKKIYKRIQYQQCYLGNFHSHNFSFQEKETVNEENDEIMNQKLDNEISKPIDNTEHCRKRALYYTNFCMYLEFNAEKILGEESQSIISISNRSDDAVQSERTESFIYSYQQTTEIKPESFISSDKNFSEVEPDSKNPEEQSKQKMKNPREFSDNINEINNNHWEEEIEKCLPRTNLNQETQLTNIWNNDDLSSTSTEEETGSIWEGLTYLYELKDTFIPQFQIYFRFSFGKIGTYIFYSPHSGLKEMFNMEHRHSSGATNNSNEMTTMAEKCAAVTRYDYLYFKKSIIIHKGKFNFYSITDEPNRAVFYYFSDYKDSINRRLSRAGYIQLLLGNLKSLIISFQKYKPAPRSFRCMNLRRLDFVFTEIPFISLPMLNTAKLSSFLDAPFHQSYKGLSTDLYEDSKLSHANSLESVMFESYEFHFHPEKEATWLMPSLIQYDKRYIMQLNYNHMTCYFNPFKWKTKYWERLQGTSEVRNAWLFYKNWFCIRDKPFLYSLRQDTSMDAECDADEDTDNELLQNLIQRRVFYEGDKKFLYKVEEDEERTNYLENFLHGAMFFFSYPRKYYAAFGKDDDLSCPIRKTYHFTNYSYTKQQILEASECIKNKHEDAFYIYVLPDKIKVLIKQLYRGYYKHVVKAKLKRRRYKRHIKILKEISEENRKKNYQVFDPLRLEIKMFRVSEIGCFEIDFHDDANILNALESRTNLEEEYSEDMPAEDLAVEVISEEDDTVISSDIQDDSTSDIHDESVYDVYNSSLTISEKETKERKKEKFDPISDKQNYIDYTSRIFTCVKDEEYFNEEIDDLEGDEDLLNTNFLIKRIQFKRFHKYDLENFYVKKCKFPVSSALKRPYDRVIPFILKHKVYMNIKKQIGLFNYPFIDVLKHKYKITIEDILMPELDLRLKKNYYGHNFLHWLPLNVFFDPYVWDHLGDLRIDEEWITTCRTESGEECGAPAVAWIPLPCTEHNRSLNVSILHPTNISKLQLRKFRLPLRITHEWQRVTVFSYNKNHGCYEVMPSSLKHGPYYVERCYVVFRSEDNELAAKRIYDAVNRRYDEEIAFS